MNKMLAIFNKFKNKRDKYKYEQKNSCLSFSQEGEDIVLSRIFEGQANGFYIDVGAHHPFRFSNTYYFYLRGWRGINIEAKPGSMLLFERFRPLDTNLELAVSNARQKMSYYFFNEPALNGFSKEISMARDGEKDYKIVDQKEMESVTLSEILDKHLPTAQSIEFMSIDVEGMELSVLASNDWQKYRPKILLVEDLENTCWEDAGKSKIAAFLKPHNYRLFCKTVNTLIFKEQSST
jgi:FkbM family methyltransferase